MDKNTIKKYLKMIGIESIDQLNQNSIDYWWKRKKIEVKSSYSSKIEIKENLIKINEAKEFLDKLNIKNIKSLFEIEEDKIHYSAKEDKEYHLQTSPNLNEVQLRKLYLKRPDLKPKEIPSYKDVKLLDQPTLDQIIVSFLNKFDIYIEPRNVGAWNGWDTFGSIMSFFSEKNSTSDLADNLFYMNRSNQINTAAQEWSTWKRWALDHQEFNSFKDDLLEQTKKYNDGLLEEMRVAILLAEEHNERVFRELQNPMIIKEFSTNL